MDLRIQVFGRYGNSASPSSAEDALFQLAGKEYVGRSAWQKAAGEKARHEDFFVQARNL